MNKKEFLWRYIAIAVLIVGFAVAFLIRLVNIDVTGQGYVEDSSRSDTRRRTETIHALRGEIYDRNGKPLVVNDYHYEIYLDAGALPTANAARNGTILKVISDAAECGEEDTFTLPASPFLEIPNPSGTEINYEYSADYMNTVYGRRLEKLILGIVDEEELPEAKEACELLKKRYGLIDSEGDELFSPDDMSLLLRVRTDMEVKNFSAAEPYVILDGVSMRLVTRIGEDALRGAAVRTDVSRVYKYPGYATHILGRTGKIQAAKADYYKELGYPADAVVGLSGAEEAFEEYLRGIDGERTIIEDPYGNVIDEYVSKEPVAGANVRLTIDIDVQIAAEDALKTNIELIVQRAADRDEDESQVGEDANAGALTLIKVKTGEVIASASYPTYNLVTFDEDYATLREDENSPLFNRALEGTYAPGSTFKPGVAAAALEEGIITPSTEFECRGVYDKYKESGFNPACWIWNMYRGHHGWIAVTEAIQVSCNCFFYETGLRLTIKNMNKYCRGYGLGLPTGVELAEKTGVLAGPEYREEHGLEPWTDGQTITAAIGQSDNLFTPLQISVYISTLINHGVRYKAHFLHEVRSFYTDEIIKSVEPEIAGDSITLSDEVTSTVLGAMKDVIDNGTSAVVFANYPIVIGGKTGTAQVKKTESDNAIFTAFAPFSDPDVVATCVIEHGANGSTAGYAARDTFTEYFKLDVPKTVVEKNED